MTLLKIRGNYVFASSWQETESSFEAALSEVEKEFDHALVELCWGMTSCEEVHNTFDYYSECPVCLSRENWRGYLEHKSFSEVLN